MVFYFFKVKDRIQGMILGFHIQQIGDEMTSHFFDCFGNYSSTERQALLCPKMDHTEGKNEKMSV